MNDKQVISIYENILATTHKMLQAAQNSDWDKLVALEQECKRLSNELMRNEPVSVLSPEQQQRKIEIIHQVLEDDAQIRSITEPWMETLHEMFSASKHKRNLQQAYETNNVY